MLSTKVLYSIAVSVLLTFSDAAAVPGLQPRGDGALKLDFQVVEKPQAILNNTNADSFAGVNSKAGTESLTLQDKGSYYVADLFVGSNAQKVSVDVDTGSSDLWVIDSESGVDAEYGSYDHSSSSSYQYDRPGFQIGYVDGSRAYGDWVKDTVALSSSGPSLKSFEFGDATSTYKMQYGILGIGKSTNEAGDQQYVNFPEALRNAGFIKKNAYSLYLNAENAATGSVLFGGIDHDKIDGDLVTLPITSNTDLSVHGKSISAEGTTVDLSGLDLVLDSGTTLTFLPTDVTSQIASAVGATERDGYYAWDTCDEAKGFSFDFGGVTISVPKEDAGGKLTFTDGSEAPGCALFIMTSDLNYILGDNFLRHAYIVYNIDDNEISIGKVKFSSSEDISVIL